MKNKYEIRGDVTAIFIENITFINGNRIETIIDTDDLERVKEFTGRWVAICKKKSDSFYIHTNIRVGGKNKMIQLHRYIMGIHNKDEVDHIDNNTLDNRKSMLRFLTKSENLQNTKGSRSDNRSGSMRGVYKKNNKYGVAITVNNKKLQFGVFSTIEEAEKICAEARSKYMPYSKEALGSVDSTNINVLIRKKLPQQSGVQGITWSSKCGKWMVRKTLGSGERIYLGRYIELSDAISKLEEVENEK